MGAKLILTKTTTLHFYYSTRKLLLKSNDAGNIVTTHTHKIWTKEAKMKTHLRTGRRQLM